MLLSSSLGLPGPSSTSPSRGDPTARSPSAGCSGVGSAGGAAVHWSLEWCHRTTFLTVLSSPWTGVCSVCRAQFSVSEGWPGQLCSASTSYQNLLCPGCFWHHFICVRESVHDFTSEMHGQEQQLIILQWQKKRARLRSTKTSEQLTWSDLDLWRHDVGWAVAVADGGGGASQHLGAGHRWANRRRGNPARRGGSLGRRAGLERGLGSDGAGHGAGLDDAYRTGGGWESQGVQRGARLGHLAGGSTPLGAAPAAVELDQSLGRWAGGSLRAGAGAARSQCVRTDRRAHQRTRGGHQSFCWSWSVAAKVHRGHHQLAFVVWAVTGIHGRLTKLVIQQNDFGGWGILREDGGNFGGVVVIQCFARCDGGQLGLGWWQIGGQLWSTVVTVHWLSTLHCTPTSSSLTAVPDTCNCVCKSYV